jgi:hypothetical protein
LWGGDVLTVKNGEVGMKVEMYVGGRWLLSVRVMVLEWREGVVFEFIDNSDSIMFG